MLEEKICYQLKETELYVLFTRYKNNNWKVKIKNVRTKECTTAIKSTVDNIVKKIINNIIENKSLYKADINNIKNKIKLITAENKGRLQKKTKKSVIININ